MLLGNSNVLCAVVKAMEGQTPPLKVRFWYDVVLSCASRKLYRGTAEDRVAENFELTVAWPRTVASELLSSCQRRNVEVGFGG